VGLPPFQAFLDRYRDDVYRFLVAAAGSQDADDCFQETFLAALRAYPRLGAGSDLRAWILTIAHRKAIDAHRSRGRRPLLIAELPEAPPLQPGDGDPELWASVRRLPAKQRAAVTLRFVSDLTHRQIGEVMGSTEEAARRNVHEGLTTLREVVKG
jgi:RNA polymerase sigma factor (sigma-70 family)